MKPFRSLHVVNHPVDSVWVTVRDRLPEIATMLDDVKSVTVVERKSRGDSLYLVNRWLGRARLPAIVASVVKPESLGWLDYASWSEADRRCLWKIEPLFLPGAIRCEGITTYEPAIGGRGSRVTFEGVLGLDLRRVASVAGPLETPLASFVESIVTTLIPRNFRKTLDAACQLIERGS